jgi:hypothetical protein
MTLILLILLVLVIYYAYYRNKQLSFSSGDSSGSSANLQLDQVNSFLRTNLNSNSLEELKSKLGEKTLDELIEENSD